MSFKRPRVLPSRSYQINVEEDGEVPLLRIHVVSARGLPRSSGAVGMPDPFVVVKFNGEKVGATKADRKTRRPEWNQNFLVRSDLADPDPPQDDDTSNPTDGEGDLTDDDDDCHEKKKIANRNSTSNIDDDKHRPSASCPSEAAAVAADEEGVAAGGWIGRGRALPGACGRCGACRRRGIEVVLEVWDEHTRDEDEEGNGEERRGSTSQPNDLFDDRLFDVSFVSRCFQRGALRRVQGAVIGGNKLIGICRMSSAQLRALGSSTVPADLKLRDPKGSWWSRCLGRGTIRVAVSLERLQATIIRAALPPGKTPAGAPLGAGVGAGGVARAAVQESHGEEALPSPELSCKVMWNGQDFASPSRWDKVFCMTEGTNQLWLDVRAPPDLANSPPLTPNPQSPPTTSTRFETHARAHAARGTGTGTDTETDTDTDTAAPSAATTAMSSTDVAVVTLESPLGALPPQQSPSLQQQHQHQDQEHPPPPPHGHTTTAVHDMSTPPPLRPTLSSSSSLSGAATTGVAVAGAAAAAAAAAFAVASAGAGAVAAAASAGATAAVATAARAAEAMPPSPVAAIAAAVAARSSTKLDRRRRRAVCSGNWTGDWSCVLSVGRPFFLSTFGAQELADMLNSGEESTEQMAGTKEWHDKGFRVHWDGVRRRFTILNVSRRSFVLRGGCSSLATELLGFGPGDYVSEPVVEALLDPQQPSDPPRRHMAVTAESLPPPLVRPHWMRILWGPPAMEIARGGDLRVEVWARQPAGLFPRMMQRRRRRRSALGSLGQSDDGSWLVGTALLDAGEVCRMATGKPTKLPLLSIPALWKYERSKSASAAAAAGLEPPQGTAAPPGSGGSGTSGPPGGPNSGFFGLGWVRVSPASALFLARQRQRLRRMKWRVAAAGVERRCQTPVGVGGANVCWTLLPHSRSRRSGSRLAGGVNSGGFTLTPAGRGKRLGEGEGGGGGGGGGAVGEGEGSTGRRDSGGDAGSVSPVAVEREAEKEAVVEPGVVGHVWVSLKLRDPSMLLMRVVRQWNMARDEASVQQRRAAQLEAKRLWMFMPGISLWRVLVQLAGMSLLVSYCVTLTLRAYHSTSCRATFNCTEETDPKLASLREWQTLADNLLSALSFLDMLLQFRTAYVDKTSKIITNPRKVGLHYLRTWFVPDLWCSLPYSTMQPLLQPLLEEVEGAADSLSSASARHTATAAMTESLNNGADSPLSLWVFKLSKRLHIGKINSIRGTRAFKYLDDSAMGVDLTVKQIVHVVRGRRKVLRWLGTPPKRRGRIAKFFFRIGVTNKWTRIVLSYRLLGYVKVVGTLVRAMRVLAVAIRAVPRAARVLRLAAVFLRSYEGRRRSKDLHEASIVIQRRAGRHMALKVAGRMQANLRRRTRACSESAISDIATAAGWSSDFGRSRNASDAAPIGGFNGRDDSRAQLFPPVSQARPRGLSTPPPSPSPSLASDGDSAAGLSARRSSRTTPMSEQRPPSPSRAPSDIWSGCSWDELHGPGPDPRLRPPPPPELEEGFWRCRGGCCCSVYPSLAWREEEEDGLEPEHSGLGA